MRLQTVERLSVYRRLVERMAAEGTSHVFSHQLARMARCTPAVVRRDVMDLDYQGVPSRGYSVQELLGAIEGVLDSTANQSVALVGAGRMGRALLDHFGRKHGALNICAAFDKHPALAGRVIHGVRVYGMDQLDAVVRREGVALAILAVPGSEVQTVADEVIGAGVSALVSFSPEVIRAPEHVLVEQVDFTSALEKLAWQLRQGGGRRS